MSEKNLSEIGHLVLALLDWPDLMPRSNSATASHLIELIFKNLNSADFLPKTCSVLCAVWCSARLAARCYDLPQVWRIMDAVKLSSKGQIVIPKAMRDDMHLPPGTEFVISVTATGLTLTPKHSFQKQQSERQGASCQSGGVSYLMTQISTLVLRPG